MDQSKIDRIDAYLNGEMTQEEKVIFETDLETNPGLKAQYEIYREIDSSMKHLYSQDTKALEESLGKLNRKYVNQDNHQVDFKTTKSKIRPREKPNYFRLITALAAMFIMILAAYFLLFRAADPQDLAGKYYAENLTQLSQTMGSSDELIQRGIAAYNQKDYERAKGYFQEVLIEDSKDAEALKYLGLTYLAQKEYENALSVFEDLAAVPNLYSNPGLFYQAFTLMMRNEAGDVGRARKILEEVVAQNAEGSRQAKEWLAKI